MLPDDAASPAFEDGLGQRWFGTSSTGEPLEVLALRDAASVVGHWRLIDCTLYVTLEPCTMCAGACVNSRIGRVVYGATDPKAGAVESLYEVCADERLNHRPPKNSPSPSLAQAMVRWPSRF